MFRILQTAYYNGEEVTVHGYNKLTKIYTVYNEKRDKTYMLKENELSLSPAKTDTKEVRDSNHVNALQDSKTDHSLDEGYKAREDRLKPIKKALSNYIVEEIWEMVDYQIAKVCTKNKEIYYAPFLNYKILPKFAFTFDDAVLLCLGYKYDNGRSDSLVYLRRLLNMNYRKK
ncbi:hypothetical protein RCG17_02260 [Neobacillus sp. PS3-12]|jgi:hypothetical protein|uniref:hypothetical protein n=1 Tax=Neobacillus sp. PS3-12 TaxID=3070677 RepID=UPI0027E082CC|nr:hypothetical protein [Neobacillus sp. PS3-12]WML53530.1 hypothetical protein RCG17_02260 [Neobacillus sp. PS3-12]